MLYQFQSIGDDQDSESFELPDGEGQRFFRPCPLRHILLVDEVQVILLLV